MLRLWDLALYCKAANVNIEQVSHIDWKVGFCNGVTRILYCLLLTTLRASLFFFIKDYLDDMEIVYQLSPLASLVTVISCNVTKQAVLRPSVPERLYQFDKMNF